MRALRIRPGAEFLQWFGLLGAALTWTVQMVVGFGVTVARCSPGNGHLGIDLHAWEIPLSAVAIVLVLLAEAAAVKVLLETWGVEEDGPAPAGRRHFFAIAAVVGNLLFLMIVVLSTVGAIYHHPCGQA